MFALGSRIEKVFGITMSNPATNRIVAVTEQNCIGDAFKVHLSFLSTPLDWLFLAGANFVLLLAELVNPGITAMKPGIAIVVISSATIFLCLLVLGNVDVSDPDALFGWKFASSTGQRHLLSLDYKKVNIATLPTTVPIALNTRAINTCSKWQLL